MSILLFVPIIVLSTENQGPTTFTNGICAYPDVSVPAFPALHFSKGAGEIYQQALLCLRSSLCERIPKHHTYCQRDEEKRPSQWLLLVLHVYDLFRRPLFGILCYRKSVQHNSQRNTSRCSRRQKHPSEPCEEKHGSRQMYTNFGGTYHVWVCVFELLKHR